MSESSFLKRYLWDSGLYKLFPKRPDKLSKAFAKDKFGNLTTAGGIDYKQAMDDYSKFYEHLRKNTDLSWADPDPATHTTVGVSPATMSTSVKDSVPNMFSGMPTYSKAALYNLPSIGNAMSIAGILDLDKKKRGYFE